MYRFVALLVLALLLAGGCGSGGGAPSTHPRGTPSPSAKAAYFERADTSTINKVAAAAQTAGAKAQAPGRLRKCNRAGIDYVAWRACWHGLLDPFESSLDQMATTLKTLGAHDLPQACVARLGDASSTFTGYARKVARLTEEIDSDQRTRQERAMRNYTSTLRHIFDGFMRPFQVLTQACYSPKDLASINASPNATP